MRNLRLLTPLLRQLMPGLEIKEVLAELGERIIEECDYELEASNHRRVARFWRGHPFVRVPEVDTELSRRRVLVTEWVDGNGFRGVAKQPDPVRDRYVEIVYRFFYGTVRELGLALGDPHPGNYLLCADGRVAFFDFGMIRRLPPGLPRRRGADRGGDPRGRRRGDARRPQGARLPARGAWDWDAPLLLDYMRELSWWLKSDGSLRLAPEDLWRSSERLREQRRELFEQLRRMTLPPRGAAAEADGGAALPDRLHRARRRTLGTAAPRADRGRRAGRRAGGRARRLARHPLTPPNAHSRRIGA